MNVLKPHLQNTIATLLARGTSQREIERLTGISRKTIRTYQLRIEWADSNSPGVATGSNQIPPPRPPALAGGRPTPSNCEPSLSRVDPRASAVTTQYRVDLPGSGRSIRLYVRLQQRQTLRRHAQGTEPAQFDRLEFGPGEEAQVDYGEGPITYDLTTGRGIVNLARKYPASIVEAACETALHDGVRSYKHVKQLSELGFAEAVTALNTPTKSTLTQQHSLIRNVGDYADLFNRGAQFSADITTHQDLKS